MTNETVIEQEDKGPETVGGSAVPGPHYYVKKITLGDIEILSGPGNPDGVISAPIGSLWIREDAPLTYQNQDGATTWASVAVVPNTFSQQQVAFVDPSRGNDTTGAFNSTNAFKTIQAAIDATSAATSAADSEPWVIWLSPTTYDEDLAIDITGRRILLISTGPWNLGKFDGTGGVPTNNRSIVLSGNTNLVDGVTCGFSIDGIPTIETIGPEQSILNQARISGNINISTLLGVAPLEIMLRASIFDQAATGTAILGGIALATMALKSCTINGLITGSGLDIIRAHACVFKGKVDIKKYVSISECEIESGWANSTSPSPTDDRIIGFTTCTWVGGNYNGKGSSDLYADAYTLNSFLNNGNTVGSASVVPTGAGQASQRTATGMFATTSAGYVLIGGAGSDDDMEFVTPPPGTYLVTFSGKCTINSVSRDIFAAVYVGASQQSGSERSTQVPVASAGVGLGVMQLVTVNGSQDISIRTKRDGGMPRTVTWDDRSMQITRMYGEVT